MWATATSLAKEGHATDLINVAEALREKKIAELPTISIAAGNRVKLVLISVPPSSGKTTFSKRLSVQ